MLITLISAKGSPGVTTTAAALAAVGAEQRGLEGRSQQLDLVELDPSGGDVESLTDVTGEAGLLRAVADLSIGSLVDSTVEAPPGVRSLLAPMSGFEAASTVEAGLGRWSTTLAELDATVVIDAGRWEALHVLGSRIDGADVVAVVCRPDARGIEHARHLVVRVRSLGMPVVLVTVGDRPYSLDEIASSLDIRAGGTIAWDPGGAAALWQDGVAAERRLKRWSRSWLARSARDVSAELVKAVEAVRVP